MDVEEIKARAEAATDGNWITTIHQFGMEFFNVWSKTAKICTYIDKQSDADFIAHARGDIPALIVEIERLQAKLTETTAERDALLKSFKVKPVGLEERGD